MEYWKQAATIAKGMTPEAALVYYHLLIVGWPWNYTPIARQLPSPQIPQPQV